MGFRNKLSNFTEIYYLHAWYISIIPPNMWLSLPEDKYNEIQINKSESTNLSISRVSSVHHSLFYA
jgi:hypothetical protein